MLTIIPIIRVTANPFTVVEPSSYKTTAAISVVICASRTVTSACLKPWSTATRIDLPNPISSLILEKIITLASTAIPISRTIPAIPGSVRTAPIADMIHSTRITYRHSAISAKSPSTLYIRIIRIKTSNSPIPPATMLLSSALAPIEAVRTEDSTSVSDTGSAPPRIRAAVSCASVLEYPPFC